MSVLQVFHNLMLERGLLTDVLRVARVSHCQRHVREDFGGSAAKPGRVDGRGLGRDGKGLEVHGPSDCNELQAVRPPATERKVVVCAPALLVAALVSAVLAGVSGAAVRKVSFTR